MSATTRSGTTPLVPPADLERWHEAGVVHLPGLLGERDRRRLSDWVDEVSQSDDPRLMHHHEQTDAGPALARTEHFADVHPRLGALVTEGPVVAAGAELLGEPVVLYKEKINFKLAGGAGFTAHQDATAYPFIDSHLTCMIAVDPATAENGCLEFAAGHHDALLDDDGDGCLRPDVERELDWTLIEMAPGDVAWFHSRTPASQRRQPQRSSPPGDLPHLQRRVRG